MQFKISNSSAVIVLSEKLMTELQLHFLGDRKHQVGAIFEKAWNDWNRIKVDLEKADVQLIIIWMFSERVQISFNTIWFSNCFINFWVLKRTISTSDFVLFTEKNTHTHQSSFYANIWLVA